MWHWHCGWTSRAKHTQTHKINIYKSAATAERHDALLISFVVPFGTCGWFRSTSTMFSSSDVLRYTCIYICEGRLVLENVTWRDLPPSFMCLRLVCVWYMYMFRSICWEIRKGKVVCANFMLCAAPDRWAHTHIFSHIVKHLSYIHNIYIYINHMHKQHTSNPTKIQKQQNVISAIYIYIVCSIFAPQYDSILGPPYSLFFRNMDCAPYMANEMQFTECVTDISRHTNPFVYSAV